MNKTMELVSESRGWYVQVRAQLPDESVILDATSTYCYPFDTDGSLSRAAALREADAICVVLERFGPVPGFVDIVPLVRAFRGRGCLLATSLFIEREMGDDRLRLIAQAQVAERDDVGLVVTTALLHAREEWRKSAVFFVLDPNVAN